MLQSKRKQWDFWLKSRQTRTDGREEEYMQAARVESETGIFKSFRCDKKRNLGEREIEKM